MHPAVKYSLVLSPHKQGGQILNITEVLEPAPPTVSNVDTGGKNLVVIDIETTGLKRGTDEIIEIGCFHYGTYSGWSTLVKPTHSSANATSHITGITDDDVVDAPGISDALDQMEKWLGAPIESFWLVAHNGRNFDFPRINDAYEMARGTRPIESANCIDSIIISHHAVPHALTPSRKLAYWVDLFELSDLQTHRAADDCFRTAQSLDEFATLLPDEYRDRATGMVSAATLAHMTAQAKPRPNDQEKSARKLLESIYLIEEGEPTPSSDIRKRRLVTDYLTRIHAMYSDVVVNHPHIIPAIARM